MLGQSLTPRRPDARLHTSRHVEVVAGSAADEDAGGDADEAFEAFGEVALVDEAGVYGDLSDGDASGKHLLRPLDADLGEVSVWGEADLALKDPDQVEGTEASEIG